MVQAVRDRAWAAGMLDLTTIKNSLFLMSWPSNIHPLVLVPID